MVATIGVSLSIHISFEQWLLGDGGCTVRPSSKIESSFQAIISCNQRKSFKNMISTFSAPRRARLSLAGLLKVLNIFLTVTIKMSYHSWLVAQLLRYS